MANSPKDKEKQREFNIEEFFRENWNDGVRFAKSMLRPTEDAEGVGNDAMLIINTKSKTEKFDNPRAYFFKTIKNLCLKEINALNPLREAAPEYEIEKFEASEPSSEPSPQEQIITLTEFERALYDEISKLPKTQEEIARLRYIERKTNQEIDQELKIKRSARRKRMSRANESLLQAALFYRTKKIFDQDNERICQIVERMIINGEEPEQVALNLGLTITELDEIVEVADFKIKAELVEKFQDMIEEFRQPKKDGKAANKN